MTKPIYIGDTALGRKRQVKKIELNATIGCMSKEERDELRKKLKTADEMEVNEAPAAPSLLSQSVQIWVVQALSLHKPQCHLLRQ